MLLSFKNVTQIKVSINLSLERSAVKAAHHLKNHLLPTQDYHSIISQEQQLERLIMSAPEKRPERTRHPTLWTVEAVRWEFRQHESEYQRLLAKKREKGPGVQLGQQIAAVDVEDREFAVAVAHHFLDRYAEEAAGRMSLEIHVYPPEKDLEDESVYVVPEDVLEQARQLGVEGDVEQQVRRMAKDATPYTHPKADLRYGRFALKIEDNTVTWIGLVDQPEGRSKKSR